MQFMVNPTGICSLGTMRPSKRYLNSISKPPGLEDQYIQPVMQESALQCMKASKLQSFKALKLRHCLKLPVRAKSSPGVSQGEGSIEERDGVVMGHRIRTAALGTMKRKEGHSSLVSFWQLHTWRGS
jgi:hypothetical protein